MAHDTKTLLRDGSGITPVPQFFNPTADDFRPLTGVDLGNGRYGADGLIWGKTSGGVYVPVKCNADGAVVTELSGSNLEVAAVVNVTLAGTRQQLPDKACREVTIIAKRGNTGYIYVGKDDVSSTVFGAELGELDSITLAVSNTNQIYIDASVSGEGISYVAI